jgi:uncharacterized SAM-binding protein YcdF (DUF218 family)
MRDEDHSSQRVAGRRRRRPGLLVLVILLLLVLVGVAVFRNVGHWLVREDALGRADVIVVLSGGLPYRAQAAAEVFKSGYAPAVWVSRPLGPREELAALGIQFLGEEEYDRRILMRQGVPDSAIRIFPDTIVNTQDEVEEISREMRRDGMHTVIIVTSPQHTRRVRALWSKLVGDDPRVIVRAAPDDPFDADHWWRTTADVLAVVREAMGLLNVWAGLPVRGHSR